jgi:pyridoxal phosphate enzyme (YggS family)
VRWHLIGHLQRNKARKAARLFRCVHSIDSERLIRALPACEPPLEAFLQINVSGEASKHGVPAEQARGLWRAALGADGLRVLGLMTMAPYSEEPEEARPCFRALRELLEDLNRTGDGPPMAGLSMGMSGDFEVALEEGATHVRIGTALAGPIVYPSG